jgi:hypothetical protein
MTNLGRLLSDTVAKHPDRLAIKLGEHRAAVLGGR